MSEVNKKVQGSVDDYLEEEDFGQLLEAFDKSREEATTEGVIVEIKNDEVYVDIGKKSEGILALSEIQDDNSKLLFNVGNSIKVAVVGSRSGRSLLSHKKALRKEKVVEFIKNYQENQDDIFNVKVVGKNKGGLIVVDDNDVEFFLPKSQYGFKEINNITGKTFKVKIIKINKDEQSIIVSRKKTLDDERKNAKN